MGAGLFIVVYIVARSIGKIGGSFIGGTISKVEPNIRKYLGFTLLPHSGVSLVFTGIAVSMLQGVDTEAEAIINEIIAVILEKQGFK